MLRPYPYRSCLFLLLLLLTKTATAQDTPTLDTDREDQIVAILDSLYSVGEFQQRLAVALDADLGFEILAEDPYAVSKMAEETSRSALQTYAAAARQAVGGLTVAEADSLLLVLRTSYGPIIRKVFMQDNAIVERAVSSYVSELVDYGFAVVEERDSLHFTSEYPYDLRQLTEGTYIDSTITDQPVFVDRQGNTQKERVGDLRYAFSLEWLGNGRYRLSDSPGNPTALGDPLTVNIYKIDGPRYHFIYRFPDGSYLRKYLYRTSYDSYDSEITTHQLSLQDHYRDPETSPLPAEDIDAFMEQGGHQFYPIDPDWRIEANFETFLPSEPSVTLATSNEQTVEYRPHGKARFTVDDQSVELVLYRTRGDDDHLFLPFYDPTNGEITYGGGRYIEVPYPSGRKVTIDFNRAYNPYCAYTQGYACPIPPASNTVPVPVEAGIQGPTVK